jgi:hypothetical protein
LATWSSWAIPTKSVLFVDVVSIEGEWSDGQAVLKSTGGPYLLDDGWCDLLDG